MTTGAAKLLALRGTRDRPHSKHARYHIPATTIDGHPRAARLVPLVDELGDVKVIPCGWWSTTKRRPWTVRAERRAAGRRRRHM